jgi:pimeloyl-ACP methyl ester carboxylesterase
MTTDAHLPRTDTLREVTRDRVTVDGDPIHYLEAGEEGPALVLVHGGAIDAAHISWAPQFDTLAEEAHVFAPNLPGYGPNPLPEGPLTIPDHAEAIAGFLDALDLDDVVLAGISMGGGAAIGVGLDHPERVRHIVALDAMALGSGLSSGKLTWLLAKLRFLNRLSVELMRRSRGYVEFGLEALVADEYDVPSALVDIVHAEAQRRGAGAAFRAFRAGEVTWTGYRTDYSDRLSDLSIPVDLIHGAEDDVIPADWSERAVDRLPGGDLTVLEATGHMATWERTARVNEIVSAAL